MSDHLLRDMADPHYLARERIDKEMRIKSQVLKLRQRLEAGKYLPMRLLAHFGEIEWKKSGELTGLVCPKCGEDCYEVGHLWIKNEESLYPSQGTLWIFCSECFYVFSKNSSINYNE